MNHKIELAENDGYLHDDGQPEIFIFRVNGRPFPVMKSVTIGEFYKRISALKIESVSPDPIQKTPTSPSLVSNLRPMAADLNKGISIGDIIRCLKLPEDNIGGGEIGKQNEQAVPGKEYLVQKVHQKNNIVFGYEAVPTNSDWPQQVFLRAQDVELVRKAGPKEEPVELRLSSFITCQCGKEVCVTINDDQTAYVGMCENEKCLDYQHRITCPRQEVPCACGEKNFLLVHNGVALGRCKKCNKDQKIELTAGS